MQKVFNIKKRYEQGYIATISALMITAILTLLALFFSGSNFSGRFDTEILDAKDRGKSLAIGCLDYARLKLASGSYDGNETINIDTYSCSILPIQIISGNYIIKTRATVLNHTTNLKLTAASSNLATISLEEAKNF